jgi:hypothetical protein
MFGGSDAVCMKTKQLLVLENIKLLPFPIPAGELLREMSKNVKSKDKTLGFL